MGEKNRQTVVNAVSDKKTEILLNRIKKLQNILKEKSLESFLVTDTHNVFYLSGFSSSNGQLLITFKKIYLITDFRYQEKAQKICDQLKTNLIIPKKPLGTEIKTILEKSAISCLNFEEKNLTVKSYSILKNLLKPVKFSPQESIVGNLRISKDKNEIELIQKAQTLTDQTLKTLKENLKIGMTEKQIAWEIEKIGRTLGADDISFTPIVAFNENSAIPHHEPTDKKLKKGDLILVDMGLKYNNYCSDMTRMIFTKPPTALQKKVYEIVLEAQIKAEIKVKAGIACNTIDTIARDIIDQQGFKGKFGHSLGHGIGLEVHEMPSVSQLYTEKLKENSIVTIEPGIYLENNFGVRIEDMVLVLSNGSRNLTKSPKKIEDCLIKI